MHDFLFAPWALLDQRWSSGSTHGLLLSRFTLRGAQRAIASPCPRPPVRSVRPHFLQPQRTLELRCPPILTTHGGAQHLGLFLALTSGAKHSWIVQTSCSNGTHTIQKRICYYAGTPCCRISLSGHYAHALLKSSRPSRKQIRAVPWYLSLLDAIYWCCIKPWLLVFHCSVTQEDQDVAAHQ